MRQVEHHEHVPTPHHGRNVVLVLAGLKDPLNVGQAFRTGSSLGISHIYCCGDTPVPPGSKINRTARGAQRHVPWSGGATEEVISSLRQNNFYVLAVEYATASEDIRVLVANLESDRPVALVMGNEAHGMTSELMASCDGVGHLPLYGPVSSLNVATAMALAVWEVVR
ncbi:MAG: TrmH family RNA methyltransferase [Saprospiraceae bacterium]